MKRKALHRLPAHYHEQWTEEADDLNKGHGRREYQLPLTLYKTVSAAMDLNDCIMH